MLRATVWTVGLFGAGTAICRAFPWTWTEPLVLFGLGLALLFASAQTARGTRIAAEADPVKSVAPVPPTAATRVPTMAAASIQVERTA